ncbi:uncharacterized protein DFL_008027 [Arthrobotrys flagrans]|uniref:Uncharacterized protein n=1 Tax=Arthrobotrys flagrans TaxID=97331 RepID=A0A436ZMM1_ARTFL|nr:hypothetical protein DFL_008027 [Arthrobotrys flagrans]
MLVSLVSLLALGASSLAHPLLEDRTGSSGCNADNVLRLLRATQRLDDSIAFCSQFLDLPAVTQTVPPAPTATAVVTLTEFRTTTVTETFVITETDVEFEKLKKRCTSTTTTSTKSISTPGYILSTSIDPSRLSSACNCLTIPLTTLTVTATDLPETLTSSVSETETETVTEWILTTETATITAPSLVLTSPTPVCCRGDVNSPAPFDVDDAYYRIEIPFEAEVYGLKSNLVFASVNGLIWLDEYSQGNYWYYHTDDDSNGGPLPLGPDELPDVAILPFWSDLFINGGKVQGIYYEISGDSITLEYIVSAYDSTENDYHFTVTLSNNNKVTITYYHVENSEDGTVAIQKKSSDTAIVWSRHDNNVAAGLTLEFDTTAGIVNII